MAWWKHLEKIEWEKKTMGCGKQAGKTFERVKKKKGGKGCRTAEESIRSTTVSVHGHQ
jgi:hypothetical protein